MKFYKREKLGLIRNFPQEKQKIDCISVNFCWSALNSLLVFPVFQVTFQMVAILQ